MTTITKETNPELIFTKNEDNTKLFEKLELCETDEELLSLSIEFKGEFSSNEVISEFFEWGMNQYNSEVENSSSKVAI